MDYGSPILVIITGGTIDAEAYVDPANPPKIATMLDESAVPAALAQMNLARPYYCFLWLRKDSKEFTEADIKALAQVIKTSGHKDIVITHGTDRMVENSTALHRMLCTPAKQGEARSVEFGVIAPSNYRIAFTGSMIPLANGNHSDGYRNLRFAMENIGDFPVGVWMAFEGKRFDPHRTIKDFDTYQFIEQN
jgi:L-asparaginase/Glu-tRNA(Gln) amidotransferase subunit D